MSDNLLAFYDTDRDAVIVRLESGTEVAVLDVDEAASLGDEISAAARRESTGYEEFFAQENGEDPDSDTNADFDPRTRTCPDCGHPRDHAISRHAYMPGTTCPGCGGVADNLSCDTGQHLVELDDEATLRFFDNDGNTADAITITDQTRTGDFDNYIRLLGTTRVTVQGVLDDLGETPGYGSDDPDEQTLADADDALSLLTTDPSPQRTCLLTPENIDTEDDCTTHCHEPA